MRKSIIFVLCLFFVSLSYGQSASNERFSVSVDLGAGQSFGKSNLSPYGVGYRGEYKSGFSGNIKMNYLLGKAFQAGLKFNLFSDAANYGVASDAQVADNLNLSPHLREPLFRSQSLGYGRSCLFTESNRRQR